MKKFKLLDLIKEDIADMLSSQGPNQDAAPLTDISLDEKIDKFLIQYEREAIPMSRVYTQEGKLTLKSLMESLYTEAEGDDEENPADDLDAGADAAPDAAAGGDFGGGGFGGADMGGAADDSDPFGGSADSGSDASAAPPTATVPSPKINIGVYTKNIARLVNNYQSLLDPKRIILNRAKAYVEKNYNPQVAQEMMNLLDREYNLSIDTLNDKEDDIASPQAAGSLSDITQGS